MLLDVSNIHKGADGHVVLKSISFSQKKRQKIAIAGETGSGKSTLLKIIAGLIQPDGGEVQLDRDIVKGPDDRLVAGHPAIAYLSQYFELQKFLTVEQILSYANLLSQKEASALYEICQIDHLLNRKTDQLSGGEKQRIALARLLISSPKLLLLDEPFSHLDMAHKNTLKSVIHTISRKLGITCLLVSHDPVDTLSWADKILVMKEGEIVQEGTPHMIYKQPVNEYVAGLFGKCNVISPAFLKAIAPNYKTKTGQIFLRPEDFTVSKKGKNNCKGKVKGVHFFGGYNEVDVGLLKTVITVRTWESNIEVGDEFFIGLKES